jgi:hypothetical protein
LANGGGDGDFGSANQGNVLNAEGQYVDAYGVIRNADGSAAAAAGTATAGNSSGRFTVWNPQGYTPPTYGGARQYAGLTEQIGKSMQLPWLGDQFERWQFSNSAPVPKNAPVGWGRYPSDNGSPQSPGGANPFNPFSNAGGSLGQVVTGPGVGGGGGSGGNTGGSGGGGGQVTQTNPFTGKQVPLASIPEDYTGPTVSQEWLQRLATEKPQEGNWWTNPATRPTQQQQMALAGKGSTYGVPSTWNPPAGTPEVGTPEFSKWAEKPENLNSYLQAEYTQPQAEKQASKFSAPNDGETFFAYVLRTAPESGFPLGSMGSVGLQAQPYLDKGYSYQETLDRMMRPTAYMTPEQYQNSVTAGLRLLGMSGP